MRRATGILLVLTVAITLLIFILVMSIILYHANKKSYEKQAIKTYNLVESTILMKDDDLDYQFLSKLSQDADIRISLIDIDGNVLIDSKQENTDSMSSHSQRREIIVALEGGLGQDTRRSDSFDIDYLYIAKLIQNENNQNNLPDKFVLRIAVEISSIYSYLLYISLAALSVFVALIIITYFLSKPITTKLLKPFELISKKLESVLKSSDAEDSPVKQIVLTKYDDVNAILSDIDIVSSKIIEYTDQIKDDKEKLDLILENIESGVIAITFDGNIQSANKKALNIFNIPPDASCNIKDYIRNTEFIKYLDNSIIENKFSVFDIVISGGKIFEIRITPISTQFVSFIVTATDVTSQRQLADTKQAFFENAGHELNTPLSSILGYSEILLTSNKTNRKFLDIINKEALRMKTLISDMLKISELETHVLSNDIEFDLSSVVDKLVELYKTRVSIKRIEIKTSLINAYIYADPEKIATLLSNLIDNSIKYTNDGGLIEIILKISNDNVVMSVKDNGIGIPEIYLNRVFERFFRVDKGRSRREGGTGLGLSIVKHIADRYNAQISIESDSTGTNVRVKFDNARKT
ncbi:MAG: GHKL domain-containing protein [Christensenellaceae bacterium]|nr:GHKL domain-containing protein [Christensenellaceae bacterium]